MPSETVRAASGRAIPGYSRGGQPVVPPGLRWRLRALRIAAIQRLARPFRQQRLVQFDALLATIPRPLSILDVGGLEAFWLESKTYQDQAVSITLLNLEEEPVHSLRIRSVVGDGRAMARFPDGAFDVVVSNSVIEHVGDPEDQRRFAVEVRRVGRRYLVQTPYRYFPIEPHFLFPFYQLLPLTARAWLLQHLGLGVLARCPDPQLARIHASGVRLLSGREMRRLFPDAQFRDEKALGLTKSLIAVGGFEGR